MDNWTDIVNTRLFESSFKGAKLLYGYTPKTWAEHLRRVVEGQGRASYHSGLGTAFSWRHTELGDAYYRAIYYVHNPRDYELREYSFI